MHLNPQNGYQFEYGKKPLRSFLILKLNKLILIKKQNNLITIDFKNKQLRTVDQGVKAFHTHLHILLI